MATPIVQREGDSGLSQLEGTYTVGFEVDELKTHLTPTGVSCLIRRGTITEVSNRGKTAGIQCECGTIVKESV